MKTLKIFLFFSFSTLFVMAASAQIVAEHRLEVPWWGKRLQAKEALAVRQYDTVLIGDSITHNWDAIAPALQQQFFGEPLNLGFSGDKTTHVLWRIQRIDWSVVAPKRIMLMIGTNNTGANLEDPATIAAGIEAIVDALRASCPNAAITVLKIFPRGKNADDPKRLNNDAVNRLLDRLGEKTNVTVKDISSLYLLEDGKTLNLKLMPDALHPNKEGHRLWGEAIAPTFMQ